MTKANVKEYFIGWSLDGIFKVWSILYWSDTGYCSLRANPLARSKGQVKLDIRTSQNYERICL